jgi:A/G-specific adenine glycosylase
MTFSQTIIRWYNKNKRDLPWRHTKDPYKIWLSEIIMQQTRVQQGLPYYNTFAKKFPSVHHLAKAEENTVMKTWQGLGYYSRARNLHHTAKFISKELKGKFPNEYEAIKQLKGIGDYTASAIASFAFDKPHAVVDGNVFRVLSRYFGIKTPIDSTEGKKLFAQKANMLIDKKDPGTFNQAIMEFGAMQCVPQTPDCGSCPLAKNCIGLAKNLISELPIKSQKTKIRTRYFNYLVIRKNRKTLIKKRTEKDIWKNLYDFPMIETKKELKKLKGKAILSVSKPFKHVLSHQIIFAKFWELKSHNNKSMVGTYVSDNQMGKYAFPRLLELYFEEKGIKNS